MDNAIRGALDRQPLGLRGRRHGQARAIPLAGEPGAKLLNERREFFQSTIGKLLHEVARRTEERVAPKRWFRPPGAATEVALVAACTRCRDCIDVCPVHAILKMPANDGGLAAGTPYIDPTTRACIACDDMPCAAAWETAALTRVPWEQVHMGILELGPQRCITSQG